MQVSIWRALWIVLLWRRMPRWVRAIAPHGFTPRRVRTFFTNMFHENVAYREKNKVVRNDFLDLLIGLKSKASHDGECERLGAKGPRPRVCLAIIVGMGCVH